MTPSRDSAKIPESTALLFNAISRGYRMDRQAFVLGHILRRFPGFKFSMGTFDDRLRLQKFIYLLQAHDIYLGYDFSWYLRGPYCTALAASGFMLDGFYSMLPDSHGKSEGFANSVVRDRFRRFAEFVRDKEMDTNFLEAAASLHFLLKTGRAATPADAANEVFDKMERGYEYNETPRSGRVDKEYVEGMLPKLENTILPRGSETARHAERWVKPVRLELEETELKPVMLADMPRGMGERHADKAVYYLFHDAARVGERKVELVGRNVFRPNEERPTADYYAMNDDVVLDIRRKRGIGVPAGMGT